MHPWKVLTFESILNWGTFIKTRIAITGLLKPRPVLWDCIEL
jgi:hypothetical protein